MILTWKTLDLELAEDVNTVSSLSSLLLDGCPTLGCWHSVNIPIGHLCTAKEGLIGYLKPLQFQPTPLKIEAVQKVY